MEFRRLCSPRSRYITSLTQVPCLRGSATFLHEEMLLFHRSYLGLGSRRGLAASFDATRAFATSRRFETPTRRNPLSTISTDARPAGLASSFYFANQSLAKSGLFVTQARNASTAISSTDLPAGTVGNFHAMCSTDPDAPALPKANVGRLWIDGVLPQCNGWLDPRRLFGLRPKSKHQEQLKQTLTNMTFPHCFVISNVEPSIKEGGMLLEFKYDGPALEASEKIVEFLEKAHQRSWYSTKTIRAFNILGEPFIEDIDAIYATKRLKVEFDGAHPADVSTLYKLFRPFGKIFDIRLSSGNKSATIIYRNSRRDGASAKNVLNGCKLPDGTKLTISYISHASLFKRGLEFLNSHGRVAALLVGLFIALVSWLVFDPVRKFFVINEITGRFGLGDFTAKLQRLGLVNIHVSELYEAASRNLSSFLGLRTERARDLGKLTSPETEKEISRLVTLLHNVPDAVAVVVGPKGSGKGTLFNLMLPEFPNTLVIDVEELLGHTEDEALLGSLAAMTGYKPRFRGLNTLGALADSILFSITGSKAGLSTTTEDQFKAILALVTQAMQDIVSKQGGQMNARTSLSFAGEAGVSEGPKIDWPVVFIREVYSRPSTKHPFVNECIVEWASGLVESGVADVVMSSRNAVAPKMISRYTSKNPEVVVLHDASAERAKQYIDAALGKENVFVAGPEINTVLNTLGGRLEDLSEFIGLVKANPQVRSGHGVTPPVLLEALDSMVERAVAEIRRSAFGIGAGEDKKNPWTAEQMFSLLQELAAHDNVGVDAVRFSIFDGDNKAIAQLEHEELISVTGGQMHAGRPLLKAAFGQLLADKSFAAGLEVASMRSEMKSLTAKLQGWQAELASLQKILYGESGNGGLGKMTREAHELDARVEWLLKKCGSAARTITALDEKIKKAESNLNLH